MLSDNDDPKGDFQLMPLPWPGHLDNLTIAVNIHFVQLVVWWSATGLGASLLFFNKFMVDTSTEYPTYAVSASRYLPLCQKNSPT